MSVHNPNPGVTSVLTHDAVPVQSRAHDAGGGGDGGHGGQGLGLGLGAGPGRQAPHKDLKSEQQLPYEQQSELHWQGRPGWYGTSHLQRNRMCACVL